MHYASTAVTRGERRLGLRSRAMLVPSPSHQTVLARRSAARPVALRRPRKARRLMVGAAVRPRSAMQWTGTPASRAEYRARAAAAPWHA
jgi:hypothetical protein